MGTPRGAQRAPPNLRYARHRPLVTFSRTGRP
jgi:hypothetical protein